jgi:integrase
MLATPADGINGRDNTFATRLMLAGVDLATVKELMGHESISTTMRYAHPSPPHKREAVARLEPRQLIDKPVKVVSLPE